MITYIEHDGVHYATIIGRNFEADGIKFFTPNEYSQQLAYMKRPKGHVIQEHYHNPVPREVVHTQEVLLIKSGKVRIDFYDNDQQYFACETLLAGDVILLATGGHGFEMLEESEMIEIKQGPYAGMDDKTRFEGKTTIEAGLKST